MKKGRKAGTKGKKNTINSNNQKVFIKKIQQNKIKVDLTANLGQLDWLDDFDRQLLEDFIYDNKYMDQDNDIYFDFDLEDEEISNGLEIENEENSDTQEVETENNYALITGTEQTGKVQEIEDEVISKDLRIENKVVNNTQEMEKEKNYALKTIIKKTSQIQEIEDNEISNDLILDETDVVQDLEDELIIFKSNSKIKNETSLKANQVFVDLLGMNILLTLDTQQLIFFDQTINPVFRGKLIVVNDGYITLDPVYIKTSNGTFQKNFIPFSFPINSIVTLVEI